MLPIIGKCYVTQGYGKTAFAKSNPSIYKNFGGIHPGVDFGTHGLPLEAIALVPGKIVYAAPNTGWGNYVEILGEDGWRRQYAHLSSIKVPKGAVVKPGDVIGRVGTTGQSTGVHLHYGNRRLKTFGGWEYRDPSNDFLDTVLVEQKLPTGKLIKGESPEVYAFNGKSKFYIPDMDTLRFLFPTSKIQDVQEDIFSKIPNGGSIPSMK